MLNILIVAAALGAGGVLAWPRLARAPLWRATITPLASIIGSGFLVLGPILAVSFGDMAPLAMGALCVLAYAFGHAVRYNISTLAAQPDRGPLIARAEALAETALAFAFVISVAYYLNLFGSFAVSLTGFDDPVHARVLTTAVFLVILIVGWTRGFAALERLEQLSVGLKLAIIAGLLVGLAVYFGTRAAAGDLITRAPNTHGWPAITLLAGLIVTVQGFETSRYLGDEYDAVTRVRSMRVAQWVSSVIYLVYICLLTYAINVDDLHLSETAIIDLMQVVAPILPILLVAAALSAQFSAAVADTSGSGGLIHELTRGRVSPRQGYVALVGIGITLTWTSDVFQIISYASRVFAAYYAVQSAIAALSARAQRDHGRMMAYATLTLIGLFAAIFGVAVE